MNNDLVYSPPPHQHHPHDFKQVNFAIITISDSRTVKTDKSGQYITDFLTDKGHKVVIREIVPDEKATIRTKVLNLTENDQIDIIITTGGTGITKRDVTPEAIKPLITKEIPGFGETFRVLSFAEIGTNGLLSRVFAGTIGTTAVFALPGSVNACSLAAEKLIEPMVGHLMAMLIT